MSHDADANDYLAPLIAAAGLTVAAFTWIGGIAIGGLTREPLSLLMEGGPRKADDRIGLVDDTIGADQRVILGQPAAADERGFALVAATCVDSVELDHDAS